MKDCGTKARRSPPPCRWRLRSSPGPFPRRLRWSRPPSINDVREYALNYSRSLPDFVCTQVTRRYAAPPPGTRYGGPVGSDPRWMAIDTLQIRLSFFQQKEQYTVVLIGNKVVNQDYQKVGGSKSFGEFGSMLQEIFERSTEAHFEWDHWGTLRGQRVMAFQYHVRLDRSKYQLVVDDRDQHHGGISRTGGGGSQNPRGFAGDHRSRKYSARVSRSKKPRTCWITITRNFPATASCCPSKRRCS